MSAKEQSVQKSTNATWSSGSVAPSLDPITRTSRRLLCLTWLLFAAFIGWTAVAEVEEVTRGEGQVIPSTKRQVVSSLEGGIVKKLNVREGDKVEKGAVLLVLDDTGFAANLGELKSKALALRIQLARLASEAKGELLFFDEKLKNLAPALAANEAQLFKIRRSNAETQSAVLKSRFTQRQQEMAELIATERQHSRSLELAVEEQKLKAPMARSGVVPKTDVLALDRVITDLEGRLATGKQAMLRVSAAIDEAENLLLEQKKTFQQDAQREFNEKRAELLIIAETLKGARDRVVRTELRSPVSGIVNNLTVNTIGGIVKPGEPLVEITPLEDALLVQARVRPQDIAFVHAGQKAVIKISSYDFSVYGGLDGKVEIISSDSNYDEKTREPYYLVTVRTDGMLLKKDDKVLPIIPGMVTTVDILTGKKTILAYLLKPINKARYEALRER